MLLGSVGQYQAGAADGLAELDESLDVLASGRSLIRIEGPVQVADVGVDRADTETGAVDDLGDFAYRIGGQLVGDVVAHPRQCAEVDLGEAEAGDGVQGLVEGEVSQGDRGADHAIGVEGFGARWPWLWSWRNRTVSDC